MKTGDNNMRTEFLHSSALPFHVRSDLMVIFLVNIFEIVSFLY